MAAIGQELGVSTPALYRYFPDRSAVFEALTQQSLAALEPPDRTLGWQDWLRAQARLERGLWLSQQGVQGFHARAALVQPAVKMITTGMDVLRRDGFTRDDALTALFAVSHLAFASGMFGCEDPSSPLGQPRPDDGDQTDEAGERFDELHRSVNLEVLFEQLITLALDGLSLKLAAPQPAPRRKRRS